jgi:hypothetical protein
MQATTGVCPVEVHETITVGSDTALISVFSRITGEEKSTNWPT